MKLKDHLIRILLIFAGLAVPSAISTALSLSGYLLGGFGTLILYAPFLFFIYCVYTGKIGPKLPPKPTDDSVPITPEMLAFSAYNETAIEDDSVLLIENEDGSLVRVPADKLDSWQAADHNAPLTPAEEQLKERILTKLYSPKSAEDSTQSQGSSIASPKMKDINPYVHSTYAQAVQDKLNAEPYDPSYHNRARNPYTQRIITCEADYEEYVREFVCEMLLAEKYKADAERTTQIEQIEQNHPEAPAKVEKPIGYIPNSGYTYIPWYRSGIVMARLAIFLIGATIVFAIIYAAVSSVSTLVSPRTSASQPPIASAKPTPTPSPTSSTLPNPKITPFSGKIFFENSDSGDRIAPLTIDASGFPLSTGFFVKLRQPITKVTVLTFYVRGNTKPEVEVPLGIYEILYASGTEWYGEDLLFGPDTSYYLADELFDFYEEDGYVNGWTITLDKQYYGNLDVNTITAAEFG